VVLEPEYERARKALCFIPSDDRDTWLAVGMALAGSFGDGACGLWDDWSKQSAKFNADNQVKAWRSFRGRGRSVGTIFWLRRQYRGRSPIYSL
jgi:putative DNA primase/helicase